MCTVKAVQWCSTYTGSRTVFTNVLYRLEAEQEIYWSVTDSISFSWGNPQYPQLKLVRSMCGHQLHYQCHIVGPVVSDPQKAPIRSHLTQGGVSSKSERTTRRQIAKMRTSIAFPSRSLIIFTSCLVPQLSSPLPSIPVGTQTH